MVENSILIPVDFTAASQKAIAFGTLLAKKGNFKINLFHVFEDDGNTKEECDNKLKALSEDIENNSGLPCTYQCEKGNIFALIPQFAGHENNRMMVIGTHGPKGIRQKFFGPDILKLLKKVCIPSLVVQESSILPEAGFTKAIFPVGDHDDYQKKIDAMVIMAGIFDPEVHLYSINRPGFEQTTRMKDNIRMAEKQFSEKGINYTRVSDDQDIFSVGFAKQTLQYSKEIGANLITIMADRTKENYYFADSDKVSILTNDMSIPVLCASSADTEI